MFGLGICKPRLHFNLAYLVPLLLPREMLQVVVDFSRRTAEPHAVSTGRHAVTRGAFHGKCAGDAIPSTLVCPFVCNSSRVRVSPSVSVLAQRSLSQAAITPLDRHRGGRMGGERRRGEGSIKRDECLSTEKLHGMSLTLIKTICFWAAGAVVSCAHVH